MKIEIQTEEIEYKEFTGKDGRPFQVRSQVGYAHLSSSAYPVQIKFNLDNAQKAYQKGFYDLSESSFIVGRYGDLSLSRSLDLIAAGK